MIERLYRLSYRTARRLVVAAVGVTVLLLGIALIFLPGPAFVVIPVGLAILSLEFAWARVWLKKLRAQISRTAAAAAGRRVERWRP